MKKYFLIFIILSLLVIFCSCNSVGGVENLSPKDNSIKNILFFDVEYDEISLSNAIDYYQSEFVISAVSFRYSIEDIKDCLKVKNIYDDGDIKYVKFKVNGYENVFYYMIFENFNSAPAWYCLSKTFFYETLSESENYQIGDPLSEESEPFIISSSNYRFYEEIVDNSIVHYNLTHDNIITEILKESDYSNLLLK